jgi:putative glutamine amidotransferase
MDKDNLEKPIIGITKPDLKDNFAFFCIWLGVLLAGGKPLKITPRRKNAQTADIDGLILGGGKDIFPARFRRAPKKDYKYDKARDEMEVFWAERALVEQIPALGICRGAQLMNVIAGGTLHMDVNEAYEGADYPSGFFHYLTYRKIINIKPLTKLHKMMGQQRTKVNSMHRQSIDVIGNDLKIVATEKNGVVQGISNADHPFFIGVQFHPEFLLYRQDMRNLFKGLVQAAAKRKNTAASNHNQNTI